MGEPLISRTIFCSTTSSTSSTCTKTPFSTMTHPAVLQLYANMLTKDNSHYRNVVKLWERILASSDKGLAGDIKRDTNKSMLSDKLFKRIEAVALDKSGPNRGHQDLRASAGSVSKGARKGSGKSSSNGKGKGKGKGVPNLHEMSLAEDSMFGTPDGEEAERLDSGELDADSVGYICCGNNEAMDIAEDLKNKAPPYYALAMLVKKAALTNTRTFNMEKMQERFAIKEMKKVMWMDDWGNPQEVDIMIFQLGVECIQIKDLSSEVVKMESTMPEQIQVRIKQWDIEGCSKEETLKANFPKVALAAVGKSNVHKESKVRPRDNVSKKTYKKETVNVMEGTIDVTREKLYQVLRRSGADGAIIDSTEYDEDMSLLNAPPSAPTVEKAFQVAHEMGDLAYGVTVTQFGLRIRIKTGTEDEAKKAMDPALAKLIGDELMQCRKADGIVLHACGLPHNMSDAEVVKALTMQPAKGSGDKVWTCSPFALHSRKTWGKKTLVVQALCLPQKFTVRVEYLGITYPVLLIPQERKGDALDRAAARRTEEEEKAKPSTTNEKTKVNFWEKRKAMAERGEETADRFNIAQDDDGMDESAHRGDIDNQSEQAEDSLDEELNSDCESVRKEKRQS